MRIFETGQDNYWYPITKGITKLLSDYKNIDLIKIEEEKIAMLKALRDIQQD